MEALLVASERRNLDRYARGKRQQPPRRVDAGGKRQRKPTPKACVDFRKQRLPVAKQALDRDGPYRLEGLGDPDAALDNLRVEDRDPFGHFPASHGDATPGDYGEHVTLEVT